MRAYLFDIDGTVADLSHRLHHIQGEGPKNWDAFFAACPGDAPIPHMIDLIRSLAAADCDIVYVSGRSDHIRDATEHWLKRNVAIWGPLYMRRAGDHRPDNIVKAELLDRIRADGYEPIMAFDDRDQVVAMWREKGIPCAQVAPGAF